MIRKGNLLSCCAAASSMSLVRAASSASHYQAGGRRTLGFLSRSLRSITPNTCNTNGDNTQNEKIPSISNRIESRCVFPGSINFHRRLVRTGAKSRRGGAVDDEFLKKLDDEEEEYAKSYQPSSDIIKSQTMEWIQKVVIGYNLCPFAELPLRENLLRISIVRGSDIEFVTSAVVYELIARSDESKSGTTVVVAPEFALDDFELYLSVVQYIEDEVMDEHELHGLVQIAPFHPMFEFAGSGKEGIDNYTNRSPYPMFHILREDEVGEAVEKLGGDSSKVWNRNVRLLKRMEEQFGKSGVEQAMKGHHLDGMDLLLKETKLVRRPDEKK